MASNLPAVLEYPPVPPTIVAKSMWGRLLERFMPTPKTSPARDPAGAAVLGSGFYLITQEAGRVGKVNAGMYRAWSVASPWVRAAIDIRRDQIATAEWDIVPFRQKGRTSVRLADEIRELFERPNARLDSFESFVQALVEDVLVLDAGVIEKVRYPNGDMAELWPTPGDFIRVNAKWDGSDPDEARYFWYPDGTMRASFKNDDMLYIMENPRTISPVGVSPLEVLKATIDSEMQAMEYNRRMVMGAAPDGVLNIGESALEADVQRARSYYANEVFGKSAMGIIGGYKAPSFMKFRDTNREMQFREWQDFLVRQIAVVFGLGPMDLGITFDVNRSTAEAQTQGSEDRGLRPLMALIQSYFTREIVWDKSFGGQENNLAFRFTALNLKETKSKADINKIAMGNVPWKAPDEARLDDGRQPLGGIFEHILMSTPKGLLDLTDEKYIGEEQLVNLKAEAQKEIADQQAEHAADAADQQADHAAVAADQQAKVVAAKETKAKGNQQESKA